MKSDVIAVSSRTDQTDAVMDQAELVAGYRKLPAKDALHLRLLAEEMMSMMRAIAGDVDGEFWIENRDKDYELHLKVQTAMDLFKREKLLAASTSGRNEAHRGFMGKIRALFEPMEDIPIFFTMTDEGIGGDSTWTMHAYQQQIQTYLDQNRPGAADAWDELEKSVVAHIADDVKVRINGPEVEMTVFKSFA